MSQTKTFEKKEVYQDRDEQLAKNDFVACFWCDKPVKRSEAKRVVGKDRQYCCKECG